MSKVNSAIHNIRHLDDLACQNSVIHKLHPAVKLITTVIYLTVVISFDRYEVSGLLPLIFYPAVILFLSELPILPITKRILFVIPFIILIGILNPVFDNRGWIVFSSIFIKSILTVTATVLLIATTKMEKIAAAMRMLKIPRIFVLQLLLTYRYIFLLLETLDITMRAYFLRAPKQKGISFNAWGSFAGQLLLRSFDRAGRIYTAMSLRGFNGEYNTGENMKINKQDIIFLGLWSAFFVITRVINIPAQIGLIIMGVIY